MGIEALAMAAAGVVVLVASGVVLAAVRTGAKAARWESRDRGRLVVGLALASSLAGAGGLEAGQAPAFAWVFAVGPDGTCGQIPADHPAAAEWRRVEGCGPVGAGPTVEGEGLAGSAVDLGPSPWAVRPELPLQVDHYYRDPYAQIVRVVAETRHGLILEQVSCNGGAWGALLWRASDQGRAPWWEVFPVLGGSAFVGDVAVGGRCPYAVPLPQSH